MQPENELHIKPTAEKKTNVQNKSKETIWKAGHLEDIAKLETIPNEQKN